MTDREKVIRESEEAIDILAKAEEPTFWLDFVRCAFDNALALLKEEQEDLDEAPTIGGWISVKDRLPDEHESIFYKFLGTPRWSSSMWQQESYKVVVYVSFPDGTGVVTTGCLHNSDWITTVSKALPQTVTHWMPSPEPPEDS